MLRPLLNRFASSLAGVVLKLLGATLRWNVTDAAGYLSSDSKNPVLVAIWHNRILILPLCFEWICRRRRKITVLTSPSRDGVLLANFVRRFGISSVHGSSSRRGSVALRQLFTAMQSGSDVAITPDGPRGPVYQLNPGLFYLAAKTGAPIMAIRVNYEAFWTVRSWDRFRIPKPFSRVEIHFMKAIFRADFDDASVEQYHQAVIDSLGPDTSWSK
ncbi:MAG: DUF374 domain-containing protein [Verrucomicrobia bacterium]|nr:DUF374 domain-containing protein [Verrucomicrobiota bacterium]